MIKKPPATPPRALCPSPACGELVADAPRRAAPYHDARERPWHADCARRALADYFRTPLDLAVLDGERVEFEIGAGRPLDPLRNVVVWSAPHDFLLHAVVFDGDVDVSGLFVGSQSMLGQAPSWDACFASGDRPDGALHTRGEVVRTGLDVTFECRPHVSTPSRQQALVCKLVGERFDPKRRRPADHSVTVVGGLLINEPVRPRAAESAAFRWVTAAHGESLACDDWCDWEVVKVEVGGGPGRAADEVQTIPVGLALTGRLTALPTFTARGGEPVRYHMGNRATVARPFRGRVYGVGTF